MAVWHDGVTGALGEKAVDMTLRLDNAHAFHMPAAATTTAGSLIFLVVRTASTPP